MSPYRHRWSIAATTGALVAALALTSAPAGASPARSTAPAVRPAAAPTAVKTPVAIGLGGAVSTVDFDASRAGLEVLRKGGNAADAAVANAYGCPVAGSTKILSLNAAGAVSRPSTVETRCLRAS